MPLILKRMSPFYTCVLCVSMPAQLSDCIDQPTCILSHRPMTESGRSAEMYTGKSPIWPFNPPATFIPNDSSGC